MDIKSLRDKDTQLSTLCEHFHIEGAIRNVIIISAYIDIESIKQVIDFVHERADSRGRPTLRFFIDKASSRFLSNREINTNFVEAEKKIRSFCDSKSGIYLVQFGALFHSKAYLIEGNKKAKILFGSMNLTQKGVLSNEELVLSEEMNTTGKSSGNRLAKWLKVYTENIHTKSVQVGRGLPEQFPSSMRQLLLDGSIYYELKEQNPFRFKLYLPEGTAKQQAGIDQLLEASITDSVSLESLITANSPVGLGMTLPGLAGSRSLWKKLCLETCYGYWSPESLRDELQKILDLRIIDRKPHFDEIKKILLERDAEIAKCFFGLCLRINTHLLSVGIIDWKYGSEVEAKVAWDKWIETTKSKIANKEYYERLISGITNVPTPDVWNDPLSSDELENSFCESLLYHWSKEYSKETSNVIAQVVAWNLGLEKEVKNEINKMPLRELVDNWLINNSQMNIMLFNEK